MVSVDAETLGEPVLPTHRQAGRVIVVGGPGDEAVVVDGELKVQGKVPSLDEIKGLLA